VKPVLYSFLVHPVYLVTEARSSLAYCKNGLIIPKSFRKKTYMPALNIKCLLCFFLQLVLVTPSTYCLHLYLFSAILIESSMVIPVHVLMLSIQAVCGLPHLCVPGFFFAVSLSQGNSFVFLWCDHITLASLL